MKVYNKSGVHSFSITVRNNQTMKAKSFSVCGNDKDEEQILEIIKKLLEKKWVAHGKR